MTSQMVNTFQDLFQRVHRQIEVHVHHVHQRLLFPEELLLFLYLIYLY
jgi:hypothetical protein